MNHFTKQYSSLCSVHGKIRIQINDTVYTLFNNFLLKKKTSATKLSPQCNVYFMEFYRNVLIEYSLTGNVKPKFTKRNENDKEF